MGIRKTLIVDGEYYHFYNRGNSKQAIFIDEQDYNRFIKLLFLCNSKKQINFRTDIIERKINAWEFNRGEPLISICSWVLMPNHFHLYIKTSNTSNNNSTSVVNNKTENGAITFMQKIGTAYAKYFNKKYDRTGSLFEGKFKSVHITNDIQARYLFSYIHLNPVKLIEPDWKEQGIKNKEAALKYILNYKYSSLNDWLGFNRKESLILNKIALKNILPENFSPQKDLFQWLSYKDSEYN